MKSTLEISGPRLAENFRAVESVAGAGAAVLAVVKADAYGHGARLCAPVLESAGARWLGVGDAEEGAVVRRALGHAETRLLVMCGMELHDAGAMLAQGLTPVVCQMRPPVPLPSPPLLPSSPPPSLPPPPLSSPLSRPEEDEEAPLSTMSARAAAHWRSNSDSSSSRPASGRDSTAPISARVSRASAHLLTRTRSISYWVHRRFHCESALRASPD